VPLSTATALLIARLLNRLLMISWDLSGILPRRVKGIQMAYRARRTTIAVSSVQEDHHRRL
jgi:hypothetical protein